jgi:hypothetical protein
MVQIIAAAAVEIIIAIKWIACVGCKTEAIAIERPWARIPPVPIVFMLIMLGDVYLVGMTLM